MNWKSLFSMQKELDEYITKKHNLEGNDLFSERILALLVELGELANETRCFKFWSKKERSASEVILEEYVDNIHFLLSIGLEKGYEFETIETNDSELNETEQFNYVFESCVQFNKEQSTSNYLLLVEAYLQLASMLGFSENDIHEAYHKKNEVNYERQNTGY